MKTIVMILTVLVLFTGFEHCYAQKLEPCAPTYTSDRDIEGMRTVFHMDGMFFDNYRLETSNLVYQITGKYYPPTKEGMDSILAHTVLVDAITFVNPSDFDNGARVGTLIAFTNLLGQPSKYWGAFRMLSGELRPYIKTACMNLERKKVPFSTVTPVTPTTPTTNSIVINNINIVNVRMPRFIIVYGNNNSQQQSQPSGGWSIDRPRSDYNYNYPRPYNQGGVIYCKGQQSQPLPRYSRPLPEYNQRTGGSWSQGTPGGAPSIGGSPGGAPTHR